MQSTVKRDNAILLELVFYIPQIKRNVTTNRIERSLHVEMCFNYIRRLLRMSSHRVIESWCGPRFTTTEHEQ